MKRFMLHVLLALAAVSWSTLPARARTADVVRPDSASAIVDVADAEYSPDGTVCGTIVNKSDHPVRDVQLMVRHQWLWNDERHPGKNSPARANRLTVADEIPPGGSAPFNQCIEKPLPDRSDGHFKTVVEVIGFTTVGEAATGPVAASSCRCDASQR